jgi:hypothetical protein
MSHFTVLVIGNDPEKQLAPYQENNMGDCPDEFMVFESDEEEYLSQYETDTTTKVIMPDGRILNTWDDEFRIKGTLGTGSDTHKVPEYLEQREMLLKELYSTFDEYMKEWCGYKSRDEKEGKYGTWTNPNSKWDWYLLGGRCTGFFKLKDGLEVLGQRGEPGLMTKEAKKGTADQSLKKYIDFDLMRNESIDKAAKKYDTAMIILKDLPVNETWKSIGERMGYGNDKSRPYYFSQPRLVAWAKAQKDKIIDMFDSCDDFIITREEYLTNAYNNTISTFAFIRDRKWYEKGEMGWLACVSNEKDQKEWSGEFNKMIDELPEDTLLSIYDCHI